MSERTSYQMDLLASSCRSVSSSLVLLGQEGLQALEEVKGGVSSMQKSTAGRKDSPTEC